MAPDAHVKSSELRFVSYRVVSQKCNATRKQKQGVPYRNRIYNFLQMEINEFE